MEFMKKRQLSLSLLLWLGSVAASPVSSRKHSKRDNTFDYIVVGGGTAGLVLADRLSADGTHTVAVVEAGSYYQITDPVLSSTPAGDSFWCGSDPSDINSLVDCDFFTQPQARANNREIHYARGKCLGGSSARSFIVQFTPPGELRAANASAGYNASAFDATGGLLQVSYANYAGPFSSWIQGSLNEIGIETVDDFKGGSLFGAQYASSTIDPSNEKRDSSQTSFLDAASNRDNLQVFTLTRAKKINFDGNKTATGVKFIVSAGAFQSPQLLMVSGVGLASTLQQFNISVVKNLPRVGQNMVANDLVYTLAQFAVDYLLGKKGVLTNPIADFLAWEKVPNALRNVFTSSTESDLAEFFADWPEIEYLAAPGYVGDFASLPTTQPTDGHQYATILMALVAPLSRGNVTNSSEDTADLPLINPAWLTSTTDQQVAVAAFKRVRQAFASKFMQPVLADETEYWPGPSVQTDAEILETIQNSLMTVWHASCTCKMGKSTDPMAMVDNNAKVFGVNGLRVVDASSFAVWPPGHPQSVIYALAEKISAQILNGQ